MKTKSMFALGKKTKEAEAILAIYPWTAQIATPSGDCKEIPRPKLEEGTFPLTGIKPVMSYSIVDSMSGKVITLDSTQLGAVNLYLSGASCCIIGSAGTGKSTILQAVLELLNPSLDGNISYRVVRGGGAREDGPPVAIISYTNKAKNVCREKIQASDILEQAGYNANITTAHNLLEYTRVQEWNEELQRETMRFVEQRDHNSPLSISHLCIDESSMLGVGKREAQQLGNKLMDACRDDVQLCLIGDINQIPPVGGKSILSYGLNQLPIAELTTIHRQALDSPIIAQAWEVLQGRMPVAQVNLETESTFKIIDPKPRTKGAKIGAETMNVRLEQNFPKFIDKGYFVPGRDIVLCPFNKPHSSPKKGTEPKTYVSTTHLNATIAGHLAKKHNRIVHHIIAGYDHVFLAVGDRVLVDKVEGTVTEIKDNGKYWGKRPTKASRRLNYWGHKVGVTVGEAEKEEVVGEYDFSMLDIDSIDMAKSEDEEVKKSASSIVSVQMDGDEEGVLTVLDSSGHFHPQVFSLGYAISIHKSQGSEWENVFVVLHDCHNIALNRELLYTAITRPRKNLYLIGQKHTVQAAVKRARIRGKSLKEKIAFFNEGDYLNAGEDFSFERLRLLRGVE